MIYSSAYIIILFLPPARLSPRNFHRDPGLAARIRRLAWNNIFFPQLSHPQDWILQQPPNPGEKIFKCRDLSQAARDAKLEGKNATSNILNVSKGWQKLIAIRTNTSRRPMQGGRSTMSICNATTVGRPSILEIEIRSLCRTWGDAKIRFVTDCLS